MTAPSATELPTAQPNVPANSRHPGPRALPSVSSVLILPPGPIVDRHRRPQERLQAAPATSRLPESSPDNRACNSLTPFRCPHAVHLYESVDSGLETVPAPSALSVQLKFSSTSSGQAGCRNVSVEGVMPGGKVGMDMGSGRQDSTVVEGAVKGGV